MRRLFVMILMAVSCAVAAPALAQVQDDVVVTGGTAAPDNEEESRRVREAIAYANALPPGAPENDYSLVAWCEALVTGHVRVGESLGSDDELDLRIIALGRTEAETFLAALEAGRAAQSPEALSEAEAAAEGARRMWAPILAGDAALRDQTFGLFFGLPGRCEHAARRITLGITAPPPTLADVGLE
jgi:hypothetical protein